MTDAASHPASVDRDPTWQSPVVGVLGGMGPGATVSFLATVVALTDAASDQEHVDMVVLNHASVPDRTAFLIPDPQQPPPQDPGPAIVGDLHRVAALGARFAVILCNTAHAFLPDPLPLPVLHLVHEGATAAAAVADAADQGRGKVTVLATSGTLHSGLYQRALTDSGVTPVLPDAHGQGEVMDLIYGKVKAGVSVSATEFGAFLDAHRQGSGAVLLGCTELSQLAEEHQLDRPWLIDAQNVLAVATIERAGRRTVT